MRKYQWWLWLGLIVMAANALAVEYPKPTAWVNDYANALSSSQQQELDRLLGDFETDTANQLLVCIMRSLPADTTLEEYSNELFERWQPGQKNNDNGALLAIFINDRMLRIETGYGVEGTLTDARSKLIIANDITPEFKQGDYYAGIKNGLINMMRAIEPDYQPKISTTEATTDQSSSECGVDLGTLFTMIIVLIIIFNLFSRRRSGGGILMIILNLLLRGSNAGWGYGRRSGWQPQSRRGPSYTPRPSSGPVRRSSSSGPRFSGGGGGRSGGGGASGRW